MDGSTSTSVTIEDCVEAMRGLDVSSERAGIHSTPFILKYKIKRSMKSDKAAPNALKHPRRRERSRSAQDTNLQRSQSTLGVRLKYQDFLLWDYVSYKRDLVSGKQAHSADVSSGTKSSTSLVNRHPIPSPSLVPRYQNFFEDELSNVEKNDSEVSCGTHVLKKSSEPELVKHGKRLKSNYKAKCMSAPTSTSETVTESSNSRGYSRARTQDSIKSHVNKPRGTFMFKYTKK